MLDIVRPRPKQPDERFAGIEQDSIALQGSPPLDAELRHFVDVVNTNGKPLVGGADGVRALGVATEVIAAIAESDTVVEPIV